MRHPWRARWAHRSFPATCESNVRAPVEYDVRIEYDDGRIAEDVRLLALEPSDALWQVDEMNPTSLAALPRVASPAGGVADLPFTGIPAVLVAASLFEDDTEDARYLGNAVSGDLACLEDALLGGADLGATDESGYNALLRAAYWNPTEDVCRFLIDAGLSLDVPNHLGQLPLHGFAESGKDDLVRLALDRGQPVDMATLSGYTPLMLAATTNHADTAALLVARGARHDARNDIGHTALHYASGQASIDVLLAAGADVEAADPGGLTPLLWLAGAGSMEACSCLIARGARIDARSANGSTCLILSARLPHPQICALLLEQGADPAAVNSDGDSFASLAVHKPALTQLHGCADFGMVQLV